MDKVPQGKSMVYIEEQNSIIYSHQIGHLIDRDALFEFHLNFGIPPVLVYQLEVYYKVDRLLTGLIAQQIKGAEADLYTVRDLLVSKSIKICFRTL